MKDISRETIRMASEGDVQAFETLYRDCSEYVYNVAWRIVDNHEDAEEVVQEVFLVVYRKLGSYRFESSYKTWIYRIATNCAVDYLRKMIKKRKQTDEYEMQITQSKFTNDVEDKINDEYYDKLAKKAYDLLPPDQKVCVVLRNVEGLSYQEIAESLKININTVRTRLKRAREALLAVRNEVIKNEL